MAHDFATQKAETFWVYRDLQDRHGLPESADIDYFLVPDASKADWRPLADVLQRDGFACGWIEDGDDDPYLQASLPDQAISAEAIWVGEEVATRHALSHRFRPDGWGIQG
jgi:hypothetical protein